MRLYRKADGTIVGTQAEAGKGFTQIDVPVVKAGLIDWLNINLPSNGDAAPRRIDCTTHEQPDMIRLEGPLPGRLTQAKVDAMFADPEGKPPLHRDEVCHSISQYEGTDLGMVALEVAARYSSLAKVEDLLS